MIVFGFLNGIVLQPILLSYFGPIYDQQDFDEEEKTQELDTIDKIDDARPSPSSK